jgi:predicted acyl esterase
VSWRAWGAAFLVVAAALVLAGTRTATPRGGADAPLYPGVHVERAWIPMPDGVRLAVNLFSPQGAPSRERFPALLEYLPYRKDDWSVLRDYELHTYFVRRGYVAARVDIRGTGASEGRQPDREYSEQEQQDGMAVIDWLARQPWSNGNVGMLGISWGGFNSIQMAMRRPPALKAIIAVDATDELFHDDIHYIDGMMHADEFELSMDLTNGLSPAPDFPIDEATLAARFDAPPWFPLYLSHQRDGAFWRRASLRPDYGRINIPVFLIGGFLDGYRDSIPRMMANLKAPVKAIVGPWNHTFPHDAEPGPEIEWRGKAVRWWDQWLKGRDTGILAEPRLDVYMRHYYAPSQTIAEIPGEWRAEAGWPPAGQHDASYFFTPGHGLAAQAEAAAVHELRYVPSAGIEAGFWWGDLTADQRPADAASLLYDTEMLQEEVAMLGMPKAYLWVAASAPLANWFVRLEDVSPEGSVTLVTGGGLSGAQRLGAETPAAMKPEQTYPLIVPLHFTSWVFPKRHRIRVAVSNALWPMIWPTPEAMSTTLRVGGSSPSRVVLPLVPAQSSARPALASPEPPPVVPGVTTKGDTWPGDLKVERDAEHGTSRVHWGGNYKMTFPWGTEESRETMDYEVADARPAENAVRGNASFVVRLADRVLEWRVHLLLRSDPRNFHYQFERELLKDGFQIRQRVWKTTVPRDHQ